MTLLLVQITIATKYRHEVHRVRVKLCDETAHKGPIFINHNTALITQKYSHITGVSRII